MCESNPLRWPDLMLTSYQARPSPRQKPHPKMIFTTWAILVCILLAGFWILPPTPLKLPERGSTPLVVYHTTCSPQIRRSAPPYAAVTTSETFFVAGQLSSSLSPIPPMSIPPVHHSGPSTVLVDDGLCFSHLGGRGGLTIVSKLVQYRITHLTINNSPVDRFTHRAYHPKEGTLWGLIEGDLPFNLTTRSARAVSDNAAYIMLGSFCFDPQLSVSQTYPIQYPVEVHDQLRFSVFYLEIENNWGGSHTCLCHIVLHGE